MNWQTFKQKLQQHPELLLQFQYAENAWVDASYHITEIKQAPIVSVDCGGKMNAWTEVIIQLWEPSASANKTAMAVNKALKIIELVEKSLPLNPAATIKIEFGNTRFDTRQMHPDELIIDGENLIVNLLPDLTQCKANDRGESCGTAETVVSCCSPGSGCC
ncbi:MAG: DUF6428 family protein [Bacteroidota bacterium]